MWRVYCVGQTSGVAVASAVFQSRLDTEPHRRIHVPGAEKVHAFDYLPVHIVVLTDYASHDPIFAMKK